MSVAAFNRYYFDILKKIRGVAKEIRDADGAGANTAREILRAMKRHYSSWDRESAEYRDWLMSATEASDAWDAYLVLGDLAEAGAEAGADAAEATPPPDNLERLNEAVPDAEIYRGISARKVFEIFSDKLAFHYFLTLLLLLKDPALTDEDAAELLGHIKDFSKGGAAALPEDAPMLLRRAEWLYRAQKKSAAAAAAAAGAAAGAAGPGDGLMRELENTSLGRLAKEVMDEINLDELQTSVGEDGDMMKALANPDSGLLKLMGSVSQKMISKLASGELNQESILKDAMTFANKMGMGDLGKMGGMMSSMMSAGAGAGGSGAGGSGAGGGFDLDSLTSLMGGLMGGGAGAGNARPSRSRGAGAGAAGGPVAAAAARRHQARQRLERRRKENEGKN